MWPVPHTGTSGIHAFFIGTNLSLTEIRDSSEALENCGWCLVSFKSNRMNWGYSWVCGMVNYQSCFLIVSLSRRGLSTTPEPHFFKPQGFPSAIRWLHGSNENWHIVFFRPQIAALRNMVLKQHSQNMWSQITSTARQFWAHCLRSAVSAWHLSVSDA